MNENGQVSVKAVAKAMRRLHVEDGDFILIKRGTPLSTIDALDKLSQAIGTAGKTKVILAVVDDFDDLHVLNEQAMNSHGWFRVPALKKLIHLKEEAEDETESTDAPDDQGL